MKLARVAVAWAASVALGLGLGACGSTVPSLQEQANQVASALQGLATDPVALVSGQASDELRDKVAEFFVPGSKVSPDVKSWAPDGPNKGTMVVTVEPPDQEPQEITVVVIIEDSDWKISDIVPEEPPDSPSDSPEPGLRLNPIVFDAIGQPPESVEQVAGKYQGAFWEDGGPAFVYGDYCCFGFSEYSGDNGYMAPTDDLSSLQPMGICNIYLGKLSQIIDGTTEPISVSELDGLFGNTGTTHLEPGEYNEYNPFGFVEYEYAGLLVAINFSADSGGMSVTGRDSVYVIPEWKAGRDW